MRELIELSRRYGADPNFILAGGGNTSFKTADRLWVKASGHSLATIDETGFVELDREKLESMLSAEWPKAPGDREAAFAKRLMAARVDPAGGRPSVEALLHHLLPGRFVVHTHPAAVNAVTCRVNGEDHADYFFGRSTVWQPYVDPGLTLAVALRKTLETAGTFGAGGASPSAKNRLTTVLLQNHGLIVSADEPAAIIAETDRRMASVTAKLEPLRAVPLSKSLEPFQSAMGGRASVDTSAAISWLVGTREGMRASELGPLTPDQIVYCRSMPVWVDEPTDLPAALERYRRAYSVEPWVVLVPDGGMLAVRDSEKMAAVTRAVYADAAKVMFWAGQVRPLPERDRQFIEHWEVEAYRRAVAAKS